MDKITIGLFTDSFYPMLDGVVMVVDNYAKRLLKYANVIVFAPNIKKDGKRFDDKSLPYKVERCKSIKFPFIDYFLPMPKIDREFMRTVNKYKLDIVHIHSPFMIGEAGIKYAKTHHVPVVGTMHSQFRLDFERAVKNKKFANMLNNRLIKTFNKCDECWAVNKEVARIFYEDYHYKELPKVMNNATEMLPYENVLEAKDEINKLYNLKDEKVFIFVGRINKLKNIFFIVDALKKVKELDKDLNFKMLFVGNGQDEENLRKRIINNHLENDVIMCGKVVDRIKMSKYLTRADLFLFPSLYDASSIVQIEAASQKLPVLFIKGAATTSTVTDNVNGFIEENDINLYAKRIINIMHDEKLYKEVSENAYKDLYKNWDDAILEVYNSYINLINKNN